MKLIDNFLDKSSTFLRKILNLCGSVEIEKVLDKITMYRLMLYFLLLLVIIAIVYCFLGIISYNPISLIFSSIFLTIVCFATNKIFSKIFNAPTNVESLYISALILTLIITPAGSFNDLPFLFWAGVSTTASKYILAIGKHIFNPVAIGVTLTALAGAGTASWWVGNPVLLPFVFLGIFIVRKLRRGYLFFSFLIATSITTFLFSFLSGNNALVTLIQTIFASYLFFFAFVMLTEPQTTPPTKKLQSMYGILVGILFAPQFHLGSFYLSPELALVVGNIFSYLVSPKYKLILNLKEKVTTGTDLIDFVFNPGEKLSFLPGQYMEWTLAHPNTDSRGNRRYFTIASSPTEDALRLGVRFYENGSSFKKALKNLSSSNKIVVSSLGGDFTLPLDKSKKLVFIAGGIGITPFRSMIKYLIDNKEKRPIVLFYANKSADEIIYTEILNKAQTDFGIKIIYTLTDQTKIAKNWKGSVGRIDAAMIKKEIPDFTARTFYLSGPHAMVVAYEEVLKDIGVAPRQIKKDFFPGYV